MITRTEEEMLALILGLAEADDRIRVVVMNGSRVNPHVAREPSLPPPTESSYFIAEPTQELYDGCCTAFFFALGPGLDGRNHWDPRASIWKAS